MEHTVIVRDRSAVLDATPGICVCGDCGIEENSLDRQLPAGWDRHDHQGCTVVRCGDCNEAIEREHRGLAPGASGGGATDELPPLVLDAVGWTKLPDRGWVFAYTGCRLLHWPLPEKGGVALQVIGGDTPGQATSVDDAALMMLSRADLRVMIDHLQAIDASLEARPALSLATCAASSAR